MLSENLVPQPEQKHEVPTQEIYFDPNNLLSISRADIPDSPQEDGMNWPEGFTKELEKQGLEPNKNFAVVDIVGDKDESRNGVHLVDLRDGTVVNDRKFDEIVKSNGIEFVEVGGEVDPRDMGGVSLEATGVEDPAAKSGERFKEKVEELAAKTEKDVAELFGAMGNVDSGGECGHLLDNVRQNIYRVRVSGRDDLKQKVQLLRDSFSDLSRAVREDGPDAVGKTGIKTKADEIKASVDVGISGMGRAPQSEDVLADRKLINEIPESINEICLRLKIAGDNDVEVRRLVSVLSSLLQRGDFTDDTTGAMLRSVDGAIGYADGSWKNRLNAIAHTQDLRSRLSTRSQRR